MKKWVVYLLGILTGFVLAILIPGLFFLFTYFLGISNRPTTFTEAAKNSEKIKLFEKPGDVVKNTKFHVIEVIYDDAAFVRSESTDTDILSGAFKYLLINKEGKYYYDGEIIEAPQGKVFRQIGIYRNVIETLPIITIMDE